MRKLLLSSVCHHMHYRWKEEKGGGIYFNTAKMLRMWGCCSSLQLFLNFWVVVDYIGWIRVGITEDTVVTGGLYRQYESTLGGMNRNRQLWIRRLQPRLGGDDGRRVLRCWSPKIQKPRVWCYHEDKQGIGMKNNLKRGRREPGGGDTAKDWWGVRIHGFTLSL